MTRRPLPHNAGPARKLGLHGPSTARLGLQGPTTADNPVGINQNLSLSSFPQKGIYARFFPPEGYLCAIISPRKVCVSLVFLSFCKTDWRSGVLERKTTITESEPCGL